ncbi:hypothetical protein OQA88_5880 [Cercophora sp. LCS_1]
MVVPRNEISVSLQAAEELWLDFNACTLVRIVSTPLPAYRHQLHHVDSFNKRICGRALVHIRVFHCGLSLTTPGIFRVIQHPNLKSRVILTLQYPVFNRTVFHAVNIAFIHSPVGLDADTKSGTDAPLTGPCNRAGIFNCVRGTSHQRCVNNIWSAGQAVPSGMQCAGRGGDFAIVPASVTPQSEECEAGEESGGESESDSSDSDSSNSESDDEEESEAAPARLRVKRKLMRRRRVLRRV